MLKKYLFFIVLFLGLNLSFVSFAQDFESLNLINQRNWADYFNQYMGDLYFSHGCLHLSPSDIFLLTQTIKPQTLIEIKPYKLKPEDVPFNLDKINSFASLVKNEADLAYYKNLFNALNTKILVYPSLDCLVIFSNLQPLAKIKIQAGPAEDFLMAFDVAKGQAIEWDFSLATPTDAGIFRVLKSTDHYISSAYYKNTIIPFGAWLVKKQGAWLYEEKGQWFRVPEHVAKDIEEPFESQQYNYFDITFDKAGKAVSGRWAGHDFGRDVLLWTNDGRTHYPEMAYAAGELVYEQILFRKDLVQLLTFDGGDEFEEACAQNANFSLYKQCYEFKSSQGQAKVDKILPQYLAYYKLFNNLPLSSADYQAMDERLAKAFYMQRENRLPRNKAERQKAIGLYEHLRLNSAVIDKQALWYENTKKDWAFFKSLRQALRKDFELMGVFSLENRQNILEDWLNQRLEFRTAFAPSQAKYVKALTFSEFFKPDEKSVLFNERERKAMLKFLQKSKAGGNNLQLKSISALNDYNFGLLLNEILGDLYKSHGCLHVSPRYSLFLYDLLPVGTKIFIHEYSEKVTEEVFAEIPYLSQLADFQEDLNKLKEKFIATSEVKVEVFPSSGIWIIKLQDKPLAKLRVKGGPQAKMYLVQGRDEKGRPIFEDHLAYPTTSGTFYVFKKAKDYKSNIYADTTAIPMGGEIRIREREKNEREEKAQWVYENEKKEWILVPYSIQADLNKPKEQREYTYYDPVVDASGEVVSIKWGSHPFGTFALQTTRDKKTAFPELIHSSGDLIMEERSLINDLIEVLSAPHDDLDECIKYNRNFDLYKNCYDFTQNPSREDLIQEKERAAYKLYLGLSLSSLEAKTLPLDVVAADKFLRNKELNAQEIKVLTDEGIISRRSGKLRVNQEKILGLSFDTYQYVVAIQKYSHHYQTLKKYWPELSNLRKSMLQDFNNFVIKDPEAFKNFVRELMLKRTNLERVSEGSAQDILEQMLLKSSGASSPSL